MCEFLTALYGLAMAMMGIISIFGYSIFLRAIWGRKDLQERSIFLMSLCVSDFAIVFGHMLRTVIATVHPAWTLGPVGCQINAVFGMAPSFVSISNVALIAYDIYCRECDKKKYRVNYGFYIAFAWAAGIFGGLLPLIGLAAYGFESNLKVGCLLDFRKSSESDMIVYLAIISTLWFAYPIRCITRYYGKLKEETGNGFLLNIVPTQMLCSWGPYAFFCFLTLFFGPDEVPQVFFTVVSNLAAKISLVTNPFIYIFFDDKLRVACCEIVCGRKEKKKCAATKAFDRPVEKEESKNDPPVEAPERKMVDKEKKNPPKEASEHPVEEKEPQNDPPIEDPECEMEKKDKKNPTKKASERSVKKKDKKRNPPKETPERPVEEKEKPSNKAPECRVEEEEEEEES